VTPKEMRAKAAMLLERAHLPQKRGAALMEAVLELVAGGPLPNIEMLYA
jgi:hypothetical protein